MCDCVYRYRDPLCVVDSHRCRGFFPLKSLTLRAGILRAELESSANGVELQFDATE